jgi:hypothetical protein
MSKHKTERSGNEEEPKFENTRESKIPEEGESAPSFGQHDQAAEHLEDTTIYTFNMSSTTTAEITRLQYHRLKVCV